jgi:peptidoglycan hydrolase-like protein with peptidoglycan-binding domain
MKVLEAHGKPPRRFPRWLIALGVIVLIGVAAGAAYTVGKSSDTKPPHATTGATTTTPADAVPLTVSSSTPATGDQYVASNATISITFSARVPLGSVRPTLAPPVAGSWVQAGPRKIRYDLTAPFIPSSNEVLTIPGGPHGLKAKDGSTLPGNDTINFTVADGNVLRLQQLLAQLDYMPVSFTPTGATVAPQDTADPVPGNFAWRWPTLPAALTSQWIEGTETVITKAAVMTFENDNGMTVDGLAGPEVWTTLLNDAATQKVDTAPYVYVLVSKVLPENLTLYNNGVAQYSGIPVNTGAPGADTTDGTYPVFEHVTSSVMKGTNPNGTTYDDPDVPWASFFLGGDALHGFVRAKYGFPQSNGCVEMTVADAAMLWPLTPIGTLVTVVGPSSGGPPATTAPT